MRTVSYLGLVAGLAVMVFLISREGITDVVGLLFTAGWSILIVPAAWLPAYLPAAQSWRVLFTRDRRPAYFDALLALWAGRAVNALLPVATIGGEVVKARLLVLWRTPTTDAVASVVVDKAVQALAVVPWGLTGALLLWLIADDRALAGYALAGMAVLAVAVAAFVLIQLSGMFGLLHKTVASIVNAPSWRALHVGAADVDAKVVTIYRRRGRFAWAVALRYAGLVLQTLEIWLAAYVLGHPLTIVEALLLKSLSATLSDAAFVVPNSYGVQEGAFILIGGLLGIGADVMLAMSLAIRLRDLFVDLPGLLWWQYLEGRSILGAKRG